MRVIWKLDIFVFAEGFDIPENRYFSNNTKHLIVLNVFMVRSVYL